MEELIILSCKQEDNHNNFQGIAKQDCFYHVCGEELQSIKKLF